MKSPGLSPSEAMLRTLRGDPPADPAVARARQRRLAGAVDEEDRVGTLTTLAGADVGHHGRRLRAVTALFSYPELVALEESTTEEEERFPYLPGLLALREAPAIIAAVEGLERQPDVLLCDGHGRAHPRRFGLACHVGVALGCCTIGVAKSLYVGEHQTLPSQRGAWVALRDGGETIGAVVRTRTAVRPLYVSVGHRISLPTAVEVVLAAAPRFRSPEPLRRAHRLASAAV